MRGWSDEGGTERESEGRSGKKKKERSEGDGCFGPIQMYQYAAAAAAAVEQPAGSTTHRKRGATVMHDMAAFGRPAFEIVVLVDRWASGLP